MALTKAGAGASLVGAPAKAGEGEEVSRKIKRAMKVKLLRDTNVAACHRAAGEVVEVDERVGMALVRRKRALKHEGAVKEAAKAVKEAASGGKGKDRQ